MIFDFGSQRGVSSVAASFIAASLLVYAPGSLWAEPVLVLRSSAGLVEVETEEVYSAAVVTGDRGITLQIRLAARPARSLARLTLGEALGLPMAAEICGTVWANQIVGEPIVTGSIVIPMPDLETAQVLERQLSAGLTCP